jgi:hypothetical protein
MGGWWAALTDGRLGAAAVVVLALGCVAFGLLKLTVGSLAVLAPTALLDRLAATPPTSWFITEDRSLAGVYVDVVLMLFGAYTIAHGVVLLLQAPDGPVRRVMDDARFKAAVFATVGTLIAGFYFLVLFTALPIPKEPSDAQHYEWMLLVGLTFLYTPPLLLLARTVWLWGLRGAAARASTYVWLAAIGALTAVIALWGVKVAAQPAGLRPDASAISALALLPLNVFP